TGRRRSQTPLPRRKLRDETARRGRTIPSREPRPRAGRAGSGYRYVLLEESPRRALRATSERGAWGLERPTSAGVHPVPALRLPSITDDAPVRRPGPGSIPVAGVGRESVDGKRTGSGMLANRPRGTDARTRKAVKEKGHAHPCPGECLARSQRRRLRAPLVAVAVGSWLNTQHSSYAAQSRFSLRVMVTSFLAPRCLREKLRTK